MSGKTDRNLASLIADTPVESGRLRFLSSAFPLRNADYVLVWMQKAQRSRDNPALEIGFHLAVNTHARRAAILVADEGKLAFERRWREDIASEPGFPPLVLVETESVVPLYLALPASVPEGRIAARAADFPSNDELFSQPAQHKPTLLRIRFAPGWRAGTAKFRQFLDSGALERYEHERNDPGARGQSDMSPYLHFGQVSPVALAKAALEYSASAAQTYIEQLVVRRELALNYVLFNPDYGHYESATPEWARKSLAARDDRRAIYSRAELESGQTGDPWWNAAQKEMLLTGKMHNYMRMYWGKQVLSWFPDPALTFDILVSLNDTYSLDGRDPNGYAGIAWCFGRHDRPWPMRPYFGNVRSMTASGLRKKFDVERYAAEVEDLYNVRRKEQS